MTKYLRHTLLTLLGALMILTGAACSVAPPAADGPDTAAVSGEEQPAPPLAAPEPPALDIDAGPIGSTFNDQVFIQTLDELGVNYGTTESGLAMGHAACDALSTGVPVMDVVAIVTADGFYTPEQAASIVGAASGSICLGY